jgi:hypothetical protein
MTSKESRPPGLALWLLRHACPGESKEALAGDLVERFREGQTRSWFWRQVLIASTIGVLSSIRRRWPLFCYAFAGTAAMVFSSYIQPLGPASVHSWQDWSDLPWPWSQLVFELSSPAIVALASLSFLAAGLVIARSFRWASLLRTWIINLALIAIGHYSIDLFPWLLRSIPGDPNHMVLIVPGAVQLLLIASAFLVAAWLGCPLVKHAHKSESRVAEPQ